MNFSLEQKTQILELYRKNVNNTQIGILLNLNRKKISKFLKEEGLETNKIKITIEEEEKIEELVRAGKNITEIKKILKRSECSISRIIKKRGIRSLVVESTKKYNYNESFFEKIDNEEKAYWLGFLCADGNIIRKKEKLEGFELRLAKKDEKHLIVFAKTISANLVETQIKTKFKKIKEEVSESKAFSVYSRKMATDLIKLGCVANKSLILEFPTKEQVPDKLINHFMRGYFDGDGCIYISTKHNKASFDIVGTEKFCESYRLKLNEKITKKERKKFAPAGKNVIFRESEKKRIKEIEKFLYCGATVFLERKREKFKQITENGKLSSKTENE